jgi:hypothetical protein
MAETPHIDAAEQPMIEPLPGQIPLRSEVYQPASDMLAQRQHALEIAQARLADAPEDPAAQQLVDAMKAEMERFAPSGQTPGS